MTYEGYIYKCLRLNIKKNSYRTFKLSQSNLAEKIINHVGLTVSESLKERDTSAVKPLLHKEKSSIGRKCIQNYRTEVGMLSYLQVSTRPEISMAVHQCAHISIIRVLCTKAVEFHKVYSVRITWKVEHYCL